MQMYKYTWIVFKILVRVLFLSNHYTDAVTYSCFAETDDSCVGLHITTSQNVRELVGFGPNFIAKNVAISFAYDSRTLSMEHVMSAVELAFPNKVAQALKKVLF